MAQRGRTAASVHDTLKERILRHDLAPGEKLREADLASAMGVSRTPVREALRRLQVDGLVSFIPNVGAQVAQYNKAEVDEVFRIRVRLDGEIARLAADRATGEQLETLQKAADVMSEVALRDDTIDDLIAANREFHRLLGEAADSRRLAEMRFGLIDVPIVWQIVRTYTPRIWARSVLHHQELMEALQEHDGDWAEAIATAHVLSMHAWTRTCGARQPTEADQP